MTKFKLTATDLRLLALSLLSAATLYSSTVVAANNCEALFTPAKGTLEYLTQKQREKRSQSQFGQIPEFLNPKKEIEMAGNWKGELGPKLLNEFLPEGVTFISHQLRDSKGEGIVKDPGSGEFVLLRVQMPWKGQSIGVNVSVPASSLAANLGKKDKFLVGPGTEAVLDWGHGGGTKTTGGHTSVGLMGHLFRYGIAVIALDQPWHGEGPRNYFENADDYFAFRAAFLKKYVHPSVPAIGVGHSMGGLFADMMMRRSDQSAMGLKDVYKGFISLSGVVDQKPGANFKEKTWAETAKDAEQKFPEVQSRIAPGDLGLGENLVRQDKVSPLSMMFVQFMNLFHDWTKPSHGGKDYLKTLYVWGEADYLYVGNEKLIHDYLKSLSNTRVLTFTPRIDFKGRVVPVGHLIFDHSRTFDHPEANAIIIRYASETLKDARVASAANEQEQLRLAKETFFSQLLKKHYTEDSASNPANMTSEAFLAGAFYWDANFKIFLKSYIKEWKQNKSGKSLADNEFDRAEKEFLIQFNHSEFPETYTLVREFIEELLGKKLEVRKNQADMGAIVRLFQAYANILTFREFIDEAEMRVPKQTEALVDLNRQAEELGNFLRAVDKIEKNNKLSTEEKNLEINKAQDGLNQSLKGLSLVELRTKFKMIDQIRNRNFIPANRQQEAKVNIQAREDIKIKIKKASEDKDNLRRELDKKSQLRSKLDKELAELIEQSQEKELISARQASEEALMRLLSVDEKVRNGIDTYIAYLHGQGLLTPENQKNIPETLQKTFDDYEKHSKFYQASLAKINQLSKQAALTGTLGSRGKEVAEQIFGATTQTGLEKDIQKLSQDANRLEGQILALKKQDSDLLEEYFTKIVPGYFTMEVIRLKDLLNQDYSQWQTVKGQIEKAWAQWQSLWKDKPPTESIELY